MRLALAALALTGCIGPVLQLPAGEPRGAHEWLCLKRACPHEAAAIGGTVLNVEYDRARVLCGCSLEDARHLPVYTLVPPHPRLR